LNRLNAIQKTAQIEWQRTRPDRSGTQLETKINPNKIKKCHHIVQ